MSQLKDKRTPTNVELECYNLILKLSTFTMSVCKPKTKKGGRSGVVKLDKYFNSLFGKELEDYVYKNKRYVRKNET